MAKRNKEMSRTEMLFYSDRKSVERMLGRSTTDKLGWFLYFMEFFMETRQDYIDETQPALQSLQLKQYPLTASFTDPVVLGFIQVVHEQNASGLIWTCWNMVEDMNKGVDVPTKYPKLEEWRHFYCNPKEPELIGRSMVRTFPGDTEKTISQRVDEENAKIKAWHEQQKQMMDAYYEIMQPLLFRHLPALHELEGDYWVIYAVTIRDAYEEWKSLCEEMDTTIEYDMPQESIRWEHADWQALFSEMYRKKAQKNER